jgi:hypothetical protein
MRPLLVFVALAGLAACSSSPTAATPGGDKTPKKTEICNNDKDDDADGLVDCHDPDCDARCPRCGDGYVQAPETCEPDDFQAATCESLNQGFVGGNLVCNDQCQIDTRGCFRPERDDCATPGDEDGDGKADCADSDCAGELACLTLEFVRAPAGGLVTEAPEDPIVVRVKGGDGQARPGVKVQLTAAPGAQGTGTATTTTSGQASFQVRLGRKAGTQVFVATLEGMQPVEIPITASDPPAGTVHTVLDVERMDGSDASGSALTARTHAPLDVAVAGDGTLFVAEACRILRVSPEGELSVVAGNELCGDPGPTFEPGDSITVTGLAVTADGSRLYFGSAANDLARVWELDLAHGTARAIAGGGDADVLTAEGGPATAAHLSSISRVRLAPGPAVLFADLTSDRIARVDLGTGVITTLVHALGSDEEAVCAGAVALRSVADVAFAPQGTGFVSGGTCGTDVFNPYVDDAVAGQVHGIVRLPALDHPAAATEVAAILGRLAGQPPGGGAPSWLVSLPEDPVAAFDDGGNLLGVAGSRLLRIDAVTMGSDTLNAGADPGFSGELVEVGFARFSGPRGIAVGPGGDLYIADTGNLTVRRVVGIGASTSQTLKVVQDTPVPTAYPGQKIPVLPGADTVRLSVEDAAGEPLPFRRVHVTAPTALIDMVGIADRRGEIELALQAPLEPGDLELQLTTENLHGGLVGPFQALLRVRDPDAGMIYTAVTAGEATPAAAVFGPAAALHGVTDVAPAADGSVYVAADCRIYLLEPSGVLRPFAGNGVCGATGDGGPALDASIAPSGLLLQENARRLVFWDLAGKVVRSIHVGTGVVSLVASGGYPVAAETDGSLLPLDPTTGAVGTFNAFDVFQPLFDAGHDCQGKNAGDVQVLTGPLAVDASGFYFGGALCHASGSAEAGVAHRDRNGVITTLVRLWSGGSFADAHAALDAGGSAAPGIALDGEGRVVFSSSDLVRRLDGTTLTILAGAHGSASNKDYTPATQTRLTAPGAVHYDASGHLWIVDGGSVRVVW